MGRMVGGRDCAAGVVSSALLIGALAPLPAVAQDEARIAALEAQVQMLMQEIQAIKADQAAVVAAPSSGLTQQAVAAETTRVPVALQQKIETPPSPGVAGHPFYATLPEGRTTGVLATGNDKVRLTFSGQINRALNVVDDGVSTDLFQVDNENASSRFRFLGETSPYADTQALTLFEFEWPINGSLDVSQLDPSVTDSLNKGLNLRLLEVGFSNNRYGSLFIGQGWMASDGTAEVDLSGITTPMWSGQTFAYGGMLPTADGGFVPKDPSQAPDDTTDPYYTDPTNFVSVFQLGNALDGLSRLVRVRYNTPVYAGFQLSAAAATEDRYDVALRYAGETSWARFAAAASYWTDVSDDGYDGYTGSASMILVNDTAWWDGLSFTVSAARQDFDAFENSPTTYFGKVAYQFRIWDVGRTAVALAYGSYDDFRVVDEDMQLYGLGFSQNFDAIGTEAYAGLTQSSFDNPAIDYSDMTTLQFGAMVRF